VWIRARLQDQLSQLGYFLQRHAGKALFVAILALATFCVPLKSAQVNSKVEQLWVQGKYNNNSACALFSRLFFLEDATSRRDVSSPMRTDGR
jgi:hypothetical protein